MSLFKLRSFLVVATSTSKHSSPTSTSFRLCTNHTIHPRLRLTTNTTNTITTSTKNNMSTTRRHFHHSSSSSPSLFFQQPATTTQSPPDQGISTTSNNTQLLRYMVVEGQQIERGQIIAEMMIDGTKFKISSEQSGTVRRLVYQPGDVIQSMLDPILIMKGDLNDLRERSESCGKNKNNLTETKDGEEKANHEKVNETEEAVVEEMTEEERQKWNEHVQKLRDEEMAARRQQGLKLVKKSLLIATAIDLALFLALFLFVREYWGVKTIPEFKAKMRSVIGSVIGEDKFVGSLDQPSDPEAFNKLKNIFTSVLSGNAQQQQVSSSDGTQEQQQVESVTIDSDQQSNKAD